MRVFLIVLYIGISVLFPDFSLASEDYEESIAIQRACGLSGVPCGNKVFEKKQIDRFSDRATRIDGRLQLKLDSGSSLNLDNINVNNERYKGYWFITYYQQTGYFLVQVRGWEGFSYLMINAFTGEMVPVIGVPIISRDTKRFVVTSLDLEAGYRPNRIAIFRFDSDRVKQEWVKDYVAVGPSDAAWISETAITYIENRSSNGGQTLNKKHIIVQVTNGEWKTMTKENMSEPH